MFSALASSSPFAKAAPVLLALLAGIACRELEEGSSTPFRGAAKFDAYRHERGIWVQMVAGLRPLAAGACWLRANLAWERREGSATTAWVRFTVAADPRPAYFWLNGARIFAYDMPDWTAGAGAAEVQACAQRALRFLEDGLEQHGNDPLLLVEMANIHLHRRRDPEMAAIYYRRAAELPGAPFYAARIHAELLQALGRPHEALTWLRQVLPSLPAHDPAARRSVVEARIKALEQIVR